MIFKYKNNAKVKQKMSMITGVTGETKVGLKYVTP